MKNPSTLLFICLCITTAAFCQISVKGTVVDETGKPVAGTNVLEKGTSNVTVTDLNGNFSMEMKQGNAELIFDFIDHKRIVQSITLNTGTKYQLDVVLVTDKKKNKKRRSSVRVQELAFVL